MAKKQPKARRLSDSEIKRLGDQLIDTSLNIYSTAKSMFTCETGVEVDEATFDRLRGVSKIFRCEECSRWFPLSCETVNRADCCEDCDEEEDDEYA